MVMAAFVERAIGDDRAFWSGVRALRAHSPAGARMIALKNGELAPALYAGRQHWQRHFVTLVCGDIFPVVFSVAAARHAYNDREHVEPEADSVPTLDATRPLQSIADWKGRGAKITLAANSIARSRAS